MDIKLRDDLIQIDGYSDKARQLLRDAAGMWVPVETEHLFADQFNTTIQGIGIRIHARNVDKVRGDVRVGMRLENGSVWVPLARNHPCVREGRDFELLQLRIKPTETTEHQIRSILDSLPRKGRRTLLRTTLGHDVQLTRTRLRVDTWQRLGGIINPVQLVQSLNLHEYVDPTKFGYCGMFTTHKSLKDVITYIESLPAQDRHIATIVYGITVNSMLAMLNIVDPDAENL